MRRLLFGLLIVVIVWKVATQETNLVYGPGVMVSQSPIQTRPSANIVSEIDGYKITALADFKISAKVLSKKEYRFGREADLSPIDFALGWGRMSDEAVLQQIKISQSNRWYRWRVKEFPIPKQEIIKHSANMHLIPRDSGLHRELNDIRTGSLVTLTGQLVRVDASEGWQWTSSLTRDDVGAHACELFLVESVETYLSSNQQ